MKIKLICIFMLSCLPSVNSMASLDLNPAPWRNDAIPTATLHAWDFETSANPALANISNSPYGPAELTIGGFHMPSFNGADGVWRTTAADMVDIYIPNSPNTGPETFKEIWLQISYADPAGYGWEIPIITNPAYDSLTRVSQIQLPNGFLYDTYHIIISPNPPEETIDMFTIQCAMYIDEIVVETICIPEPATISMLGLGLLGLIKRRK